MSIQQLKAILALLLLIGANAWSQPEAGDQVASQGQLVQDLK